MSNLMQVPDGSSNPQGGKTPISTAARIFIGILVVFSLIVGISAGALFASFLTHSLGSPPRVVPTRELV